MGSTATKKSTAEEVCLAIAAEDQELTEKCGFPPSASTLKPIGRVDMQPNDFRALCHPGVYIFWKGDQALYVGKGRRVMNRMSSRNHGAVGRAIHDCTRIEILFFEDEISAMGQEQELILALQPLLNRRGLGVL